MHRRAQVVLTLVGCAALPAIAGPHNRIPVVESAAEPAPTRDSVELACSLGAGLFPAPARVLDLALRSDSVQQPSWFETADVSESGWSFSVR